MMHKEEIWDLVSLTAIIFVSVVGELVPSLAEFFEILIKRGFRLPENHILQLTKLVQNVFCFSLQNKKDVDVSGS